MHFLNSFALASLAGLTVAKPLPKAQNTQRPFVLQDMDGVPYIQIIDIDNQRRPQRHGITWDKLTSFFKAPTQSPFARGSLSTTTTTTTTTETPAAPTNGRFRTTTSSSGLLSTSPIDGRTRMTTTTSSELSITTSSSLPVIYKTISASAPSQSSKYVSLLPRDCDSSSTLPPNAPAAATTSNPAASTISSLVPSGSHVAVSSAGAEGSPRTSNAISTSSACTADTTPPAPTQSGTIEGCTTWYVAKPGDFCYSVAQEFGISTDTFMAWNPSVGPPTYLRLLAGDAYCVARCGGTSTTSISATTTLQTSSSVLTEPSVKSTGAFTNSSSIALASSTGTRPSNSTPTELPNPGPNDRYRAFTGDGSETAGWPTMDQWLDFDTLFNYNKPNMQLSCANWNVPNNSDEEINEMRDAILSVSEQTGVDARFMLAIIMQESTGCVRVITTAYSHSNPGLMQSFNGTGSCNGNGAAAGIPGAPAGKVMTPCPGSMIRQQIEDGTAGTQWGPGLQQDLSEQRKDAQGYYRAARMYNGGTFIESDLSQPCCTPSYASDVANRLLGWAYSPRTFGY